MDEVRSAEDRKNYVMTRNEAQKVKEENWSRIEEDLKVDFKGTKKLLYNLASGYRRKRQCVSYAVKDKNEILLIESEISQRDGKSIFMTY